MIEQLERVVAEIGDINSKLVLLVGASGTGKTKLLRELGGRLHIEPLNVGLELGRRLAATPNNKRGFSAGELLRDIAERERSDDPLLLDNLELLFEKSLQINPLDLVKRLAHSKRVVAVWPGELRADRLVYADREPCSRYARVQRYAPRPRQTKNLAAIRPPPLEKLQPRSNKSPSLNA